MEHRASIVVPSVCIQIPQQEELQLPTTPFEAQKAILAHTPRACSSGADDHNVAPPEHRLTVLAMQLAVLEKAVSRLGTLAFLWATVVLLGGFATTLSRTDFWCITLLLLTEGARIQGRSHEMEWQQRATCLPATSQAVGHVLFLLQLLSASVCAAVSLVRLVTHRSGGANSWTNRQASIDIFYWLALTESLLFLLEKALWQLRVAHHRLLERVAKECHLAGTARGALAIRRFFYDSYSRSLKGSIFDGLHMNLLSYADDMLAAGSHDDQSLGASILVALAESDRFADSTLRKIGVMSPSTIERLIHMLSWKDTSETGVRRSAAVVVSMLIGRKIMGLRFTGIPGAIESVASLLYADVDELNLLGLTIISKLAHDHDNCDKIGNIRDLLDKIISYCSIAAGGGQPTDMRLKAVKEALLVVKRLAGTTGATGKLLRRQLSSNVFTVSNVREVLKQRDGKVQSELHQLAIEILTCLATDKKARENIGGTGGVVRELVAIFLPGKDGTATRRNRQTDAIRVEAGEALAMLALESKGNCRAIIMACGGGVERLVEALQSDPVVITGAATILRNLCTFVGDEWQLPLRRVVTTGATKVLSTIMVEKTKVLNIFLGLAAQMLRFMEPGELRASLATASVTETALVQTLLQILREYSLPCMAVPRIRRYTIELAVAMMRLDARYMALFLENGIEGVLTRIAGTTSELECFNVFSGSVGLSHRTMSVPSLVTSAMELMKQV